MSRVDDMPGYMASLAAVAIMTAVAVVKDVTPLYQPQAALCCPLNDIAALPGTIWCALAGYLLLWIVSAYTTRVNRRYNVEEGTSALPSSLFIVATASVPGFLTGITPGVLMALATILSLKWMFGCIDREQKAQPMFLVGTVVAFGSMIEYSFIPLGIALAVAAAGLGLFQLRSVAGYIMGLMTPYVLMLGFMLVTPGQFILPGLWSLPVPPATSAIFTAGVTALTAIIIMLRSAVTPSHRSSRGIALNRAINMVLLIVILAMGLDFHNFTAYIPTMALLTGYGVAGLTGSVRNNSAAPALTIAVLVIIYLISYVFAL